MKKLATLPFFTVLITSLVIFNTANAKIWRINNNVGITADFTSPVTALASASVVNGDTLSFESSSTAYPSFTLNKRLVLVGLGYFLTGTGSNTGLQQHTINAKIAGFTLSDSSASGSQFLGLEFTSFISISTNVAAGSDNLIFRNCYLNSSLFSISAGVAPVGNKADGWIFNKCLSNYPFDFSNLNAINWVVTNNIFSSSSYPVSINNTNNSNILVRNNIFNSSAIALNKAYFSNNIFYTSSPTFSNTIVKSNTCIGNSPFSASDVTNNGNMNAATEASVFVKTNSTSLDNYFQLTSSYLASANSDGETVNGVTPKRGAFGTADPYRLSGIPSVPSIYTLTVPASVSSSATSITISGSTKSNN